MESATTPAAPIVVPERLSVGEIAKANKAAQLDGVGAGGVTGFLGGFISHRLFKMSRNVSLISGLMTGAIAGYIFTQASLKAHLAQAAKTKALLQQSLAGEEGVDRARWENEAEGGSGGLEAMADKYASTRGDH